MLLDGVGWCWVVDNDHVNDASMMIMMVMLDDG